MRKARSRKETKNITTSQKLQVTRHIKCHCGCHTFYARIDCKSLASSSFPIPPTQKTTTDECSAQQLNVILRSTEQHAPFHRRTVPTYQFSFHEVRCSKRKVRRVFFYSSNRSRRRRRSPKDYTLERNRKLIDGRPLPARRTTKTVE